MDFQYVKKLVRLVEQSGINDLEIEEDNLRIKISKGEKHVVTGTQITPGIHIPAHTEIQTVTTVATPAANAEETQKPAGEKSSNLHEIKSPIVGTFYRAPAPDADAYVKVGDYVQPGTTLCIVEAMKLMNEIESDVAGKIVKILVDNGKPVEYNQPLFLIEL